MNSVCSDTEAWLRSLSDTKVQLRDGAYKFKNATGEIVIAVIEHGHVKKVKMLIDGSEHYWLDDWQAATTGRKETT